MFPQTLRALRPISRYEDDVTAHVFTLVITLALDIQKQTYNCEVQNFLLKELKSVLIERSSPQPIFELFDTLRTYKEGRCDRVGREATLREAPDPNFHLKNKKLSLLRIIESERTGDPLSPFVDLYWQESEFPFFSSRRRQRLRPGHFRGPPCTPSVSFET